MGSHRVLHRHPARRLPRSNTRHILTSLAAWLDRTVGRLDLIVLIIGIASAIVDNIPLVAASMGMYSLSTYPADHFFWEFLAYCAGTGGSILIIGSAAGVAAMGLEKINFVWYLKHVSGSALLGSSDGRRNLPASALADELRSRPAETSFKVEGADALPERATPCTRAFTSTGDGVNLFTLRKRCPLQSTIESLSRIGADLRGVVDHPARTPQPPPYTIRTIIALVWRPGSPSVNATHPACMTFALCLRRTSNEPIPCECTCHCAERLVRRLQQHASYPCPGGDGNGDTVAHNIRGRRIVGCVRLGRFFVGDDGDSCSTP